jgi:hypothetical protein
MRRLFDRTAACAADYLESFPTPVERVVEAIRQAASIAARSVAT